MSEVSPVIAGAEQSLEALAAPAVKSAADKIAKSLGVTDPVGIAQIESAGSALVVAVGVVAAPLAQKLLGNLIAKFAPAAK